MTEKINRREILKAVVGVGLGLAAAKLSCDILQGKPGEEKLKNRPEIGKPKEKKIPPSLREREEKKENLEHIVHPDSSATSLKSGERPEENEHGVEFEIDNPKAIDILKDIKGMQDQAKSQAEQYRGLYKYLQENEAAERDGISRSYVDPQSERKGIPENEKDKKTLEKLFELFKKKFANKYNLIETFTRVFSVREKVSQDDLAEIAILNNGKIEIRIPATTDSTEDQIFDDIDENFAGYLESLLNN